MSELEPILAGGPLRLDGEGEKGVRVTMKSRAGDSLSKGGRRVSRRK